MTQVFSPRCCSQFDKSDEGAEKLIIVLWNCYSHQIRRIFNTSCRRHDRLNFDLDGNKCGQIECDEQERFIRRVIDGHWQAFTQAVRVLKKGSGFSQSRTYCYTAELYLTFHQECRTSSLNGLLILLASRQQVIQMS